MWNVGRPLRATMIGGATDAARWKMALHDVVAWILVFEASWIHIGIPLDTAILGRRDMTVTTFVRWLANSQIHILGSSIIYQWWLVLPRQWHRKLLATFAFGIVYWHYGADVVYCVEAPIDINNLSVGSCNRVALRCNIWTPLITLWLFVVRDRIYIWLSHFILTFLRLGWIRLVISALESAVIVRSDVYRW